MKKQFLLLFLISFISFQLFAQQTGCVSGDCDNGYGTWVFKSGEKYTGYWENQKRNGKGTNYYVNGSIYEGDWKDDKKDGYGTYHYKPESQYEKYAGFWVMDKMQGKGSFVYRDGTTYIGDFDDGYFHGHGVLYKTDGTVQAGRFDKDVYQGTLYSSNCVSGNCEDGYGTFIWGDETQWAGDKYTGDWKNGMRDGFGTYFYNGGSKYIGQYVQNSMTGQGTYYWAAGDKYVGEWLNGKMNGNGTYYYANGKIEKGKWINGKFMGADNIYTGCISGNCDNGYGVYIWESGEKYEGNWKNKKRNGQGTNYFVTGFVYEGEWLDDLRHGYGVLTFNSDSEFDKFSGQWLNDKVSGYGTLLYKSGQKYIGDFKENMFDGQGTMYYTDGRIESGKWVQDKFVGATNISNTTTGCISGNCESGYGIYVFSSGEKYEGFWDKGMRNGQGTNIWADGAKYSGEWKDDVMHGTGTYNYEPNSKYDYYKGNYVMGEMTGQGTFVYKSGKKYIGSFQKGLFHGEGTMYYTDGRVEAGIWENDKYVGKSKNNYGCISGNCQDGYGTYTFENGAKYVGNFSNGMFNGQGTYYFENSDKYMGNYKDNKRHGQGTYIWYSGDKYVGEWQNDAYSGIGTMYYANGTSKSGIWKNNEYVGAAEEKGTKPSINWLSPEYFNSSSVVDNYKVKLCIESNTPIKNTQIFVNNVPQMDEQTRGYNVVSSSCDYTIERTIKLQKGENKLKVVVENQYGKTSSEIRTIIYETSSGEKQSRIALVMGNSNYTTAPLRNPVNDANAIAGKLKALGFEVMLVTDGSQNEMKKAFRDFGEKLAKSKGVGMFFYAGHGIQINGENYLVPVDARIEKEQDVELESVNLKRILGEMDYAGNALNIIVLDACRNNPFARSFRSSGSNGLASTNAPFGTFIAYATAPGSVAADGSGSNGLYTQELLKALDKKGLTLENVFKEVRRNVYKLSQGKQVPWDNSSIWNDFYFNK